jgi:hypothetical protein
MFIILRTQLKVLLYLAIVIFISTQTLSAQGNFRTPTIDGSIQATTLEYGNNEEDHDRRTSGATTWWATWDDNNFYAAVKGAPLNQGTVCYFDRDPTNPSNGGTNANGNLAGYNFDGARYGTLPFRADFVAYFSSSRREWHSADGAGGWTAGSLGGGNFAAATDEREYGIPWNAVNNGNGRPDSFLFFCYAVTPAGSVFGTIPTQNMTGNIGTNATATHFYRVYNSLDPINKPPFSQLNSSAVPTSASGTITGKITGTDGRPVSRAQVVLSSTSGQTYRAMANPFGYFVFSDIPYGDFYILNVGGGKASNGVISRAFEFNEDITNLDLTIESLR